MHPAPNVTTATDAAYQQLRLPFDPNAAARLTQPSGAQAELALVPAAVWAGLETAQRTQIRQTFRRVCEELVHDGHRR